MGSVRLALAALTLAGAAACADPAPTAQLVNDDRLPEWLQALIGSLEQAPVANPPAWIGRYQYAGQTVYYLPPRCCDIPSVLYAADGAVLCSPDGGLSGRGDGRCPDFVTSRRNEKIVWRDSRSRS